MAIAATRQLSIMQTETVPFHERTNAPATLDQKNILEIISTDRVLSRNLTGEPVRTQVTTASGYQQSLSEVKLMTEHGRIAMRPSGTEEVYRICAESFLREDHLRA